MRLFARRCVSLAGLLALTLTACADAEAPAPAEPFADHAEAADLVPHSGPDGKADGLPPRFDAAYVIGDTFFVAHDAVSASDIQAFFEATPYDGRRSWLADEQIHGRSAAEAMRRKRARETDR